MVVSIKAFLISSNFDINLLIFHWILIKFASKCIVCLDFASQIHSSPTLFIGVYVLWPSQPNGVMSSTVSLPTHTFTVQA